MKSEPKVLPDTLVTLKRTKCDEYQYRPEQDGKMFEFKPKHVFRPEYGTLFEHHGFLLQNLQRKYLFVAVDLPKMTDISITLPEFPDCQDFGYR